MIWISQIRCESFLETVKQTVSVGGEVETMSLPYIPESELGLFTPQQPEHRFG